jgi:pyruvate/2-oxoglutarate dehydrogenase complex dihydrolipoamide acyltransferase (E2) component
MQNQFQVPAKPWTENDIKFLMANVSKLSDEVKEELGLSTTKVDTNVASAARADIEKHDQILTPQGVVSQDDVSPGTTTGIRPEDDSVHPAVNGSPAGEADAIIEAPIASDLPAAEDATKNDGKPVATEAAAKLAEEKGINLEEVVPTGANNNITVFDVEKTVDNSQQTPA